MHNKNIKKFITNIIVIIFFIFYAQISVFASEVPQFNPKDSNPKPGLYKLNDMHYARDGHISVPLDDGRVIVIAGHSRLVGDKTNNTAEMFDPKTGNFTKLNMNMEYNGVIERSLRGILLNNGDVLITGGYEREKLRNNESKFRLRYEIFNPQNNNFIKGPYPSINGDYFNVWDGNNGKAYIYIENSNNKEEKVIEEYDYSTNTITKVIPKTSKEYNTNEYTIPTRQLPVHMFKYIKENIGFPFEYVFISDDEIILTSLSEIDYGEKVTDIESGKYKTYRSWYSPIYLINFKTKEIRPLNEYVRSAIPSMTKIRGKNQVLITGGCVPNYVKNPNKSIKDEYKINMWIAMKATKHAYILVY